MRGSLQLTAFALLASSTFGQSSRPPVVTERPTTPATSGAPTSYRFHAQFAPFCCTTDFAAAPATESASSAPTPSYASLHAAGGPNFQPSSYVPFPDAVAAGEQQSANSPVAQSKDATVQQMLDLIQATRAAEAESDEEGSSAPVKWADLRPGINPADYLKPPSTYMKYKEAVALGKEQAEEEAQQPPSLGEVAADAKDARPADEKPAVVVRQNPDGTPRIVHKNTPAPEQQSSPDSQPR